MKVNDYFNLIQDSDYTVVGLDVDYNIIYKDGKVILMFLGTDSILDFKIDIGFPVKVYKRQYSCIKAHGGFIKAWKSANDTIMREFIDMCNLYNGEPLIIGHSLGGAMAVLACEDFYFRTGKKANLLTFGCPNILFGKKSMRYLRSCCNSMFQYAQCNDIIPTIPLGYRQVNKIKCGRKFNLIEFIFEPMKYHLGYGDIEY